MTSILATDIGAALNQGLGQWQAENYWPISEPEFRALNRTIDEEFDRAYAIFDETWRDLFLADFGYVNFLAQHIHAKAVSEFAYRNQIVLRQGSRSVDVFDTSRAILGSETVYDPNWTGLGSVFRSRFAHGQPRFPRLRLMRRRAIYNSHLPLVRALASSFKSAESWNLGAWSALKVKYIRQNDLVCDFPFPERLVNGDLPFEAVGSEQARDVLAGLLNRVAAYCRDSLNFNLDFNRILQTWIERLISLHSLYLAVLQRRRLPSTILVGRTAEPLIRTIALAARRKETKIVGFQHGHNMGYTHESARSYIDVSISDEFVCPTPKAAESFSDLAKLQSFTRNARTNFVSVGDQSYQALWNRHAGKIGPEKIRSVMVVGYPMDANRYIYGTGLFWNFKLDLELRIVRTLRQAGLKVLYRPHPAAQHVTPNLMAPEVDEVLLEPFEMVYQAADAILFTYPLTSTFGIGLCSEKPIIFINMEGEAWNKDLFRLLRKRCAIVSAKFDERNRVSFEPKDLLAAIDEAVETRDYEYVFTYLFPTPPHGSL
jgi:hypothetical protein